jgi:hypothetical protein
MKSVKEKYGKQGITIDSVGERLFPSVHFDQFNVA